MRVLTGYIYVSVTSETAGIDELSWGESIE